MTISNEELAVILLVCERLSDDQLLPICNAIRSGFDPSCLDGCDKIGHLLEQDSRYVAEAFQRVFDMRFCKASK